MDHLLHGARAGIVAALILTLWSFAGVSGALGAASDASGALYVLTAFGVLGATQLAYGLGLGAMLALWSSMLRRVLGQDWLETLTQPQWDRRVAGSLLALPLGAGVIGVSVGVVHTAVTAKFARVTFQALGLTLTTVAAVVGVAAVFPLVAGAFSASAAKLPTSKDRPWPQATVAVGALMLLGALVALIGGYVYASGLSVFKPAALKMLVASAVLVPISFVVMARVNAQRLAWRFGVPVAGAVMIVLCFFGAWSWASGSADMRRAVTKESAMLAMVSKQLQRFADADRDGYANGMGGYDCDDTNKDVFPGAKDIPGNKIDEDCSGADAKPPSMEKHASRKVVRLAIDAANQAAIKQASQTPDPPKNVVVVLIDTVRQDHMGYAGYPRPTTPNIDKIAQDSIVFMDAYATAPHTPRSIPCFFFSRYASQMNWRGAQYNYPKVRPENLGWFEVLQEKGWKNQAFSSHFYFQKKRGMSQGFDAWDNSGFLEIAPSNDDIAAPRIWAKTKPYLEKLGAQKKAQGKDMAPYSVFIHLFEPHGRWIGHKEHDFGKGTTPVERHINNYDSEIAYVDAYVGKIVETLKAQGLWDDTVFILTSDHGEAFKDHGMFFHGQNLYNEVIKVPLLVRVPGWKARKINGPVSLVDVAPTFLDMAEITIPTDFQGKSLVPTMLGQAPVPDRPIFSELLPYTNWQEHHKVVIQGDDKLIRVLTAGTTELYDLKADPKEKKNLARTPEGKARAAKLRKHLDEFMGR